MLSVQSILVGVHKIEHLGILQRIPWIRQIRRKWGEQLQLRRSDLPSTRVRVLHMTVVDVTSSLKLK